MSTAPSGTASEAEVQASAAGSATPRQPGSYPPYPSYAHAPAPPSVADTIVAGRDLRARHKAAPRDQVHPLPRPARPKTPKVTDVKQSRRALRLHARCLRRHGAVLTDRLERIAKPPRRTIIYLWREYADTLPAETIARLRAMLDADEPFKPDQAYEYFINMRKTKKYTKKSRINQIKRDAQAICADKRFVWARNATVAFARGIQQRLARPGRYALADGMLRLSNIILNEICGYMKMRTPSRRCTHPRAKFMMEMSDKVAVWIDGILSESDDRMLMMDFDEDDDLFPSGKAGANDGFADDFLNMMGGSGLLQGPKTAYLKFTGEMLEAFMILTDSMYKKGDAQLLSHGKFEQTYSQGANELKQAPDFEATEFNSALAEQLNKDLAAVAEPNTPANIAPFMKEMVDICSNYLAQHAEFNKDKGPAFRALIKKMKTKPNEQLYQKEKATRTYGSAATELEKAKGFESDHDDPNLSQAIHSKLSKLMEGCTPPELKNEMAETLDISSKYLSQSAVDEIERGPAFDILIKKLESDGSEAFTPEHPSLSNKFVTAYTLKSAPGFGSVKPDPATAPKFVKALHKAADGDTPLNLRTEMDGVMNRCGNYLSAFVRDRDKALQIVIMAMKASGNEELAKRKNYSMTHGTGAMEVETAPVLVPYLPIKDIADENKQKIVNKVEGKVPPDLRVAVQSAVSDVSKHLSQPTALRSGAAGERYGMNFLGKIMYSMGNKPLFKHKSYGQTYADGAEELKYAGKMESDPRAEDLKKKIAAELQTGIPTRTAPTIVGSMSGTIEEASKHLAKVGNEKSDAVDYLVKLMKEKGDAALGKLQGYEQTYNDGAMRIEQSDSLANEKVDKGAYEGVRNKLKKLHDDKPNAELVKVMPSIIDEAAKFLASPFPETGADKRRVLGDLMARKGDAELAKDGNYKMSYAEGGKEIIHSPVGVNKAHDDAKKKDMEGKIQGVIPDEKLKAVLKETASEGAAYLTDLVKDRGGGLGGKGTSALENVAGGRSSPVTAGVLGTPGPVGAGAGAGTGALGVAGAGGAGTGALGTAGAGGAGTGSLGAAGSGLGALGSADAGTGALGAAAVGSGALGTADAGAAGAGAFGAAGAGVAGAGVLGAAGTGGSGAGALLAAGTGGPGAGALGAAGAGRAGPGALGAAGAGARGAAGSALTGSDSGRSMHAGAGGGNAGGAGRLDGRPSIEAGDLVYDPDQEMALSILHKELKAKGHEMFYQQPHSDLTHKQASEWIAMRPRMRVDKSVKESGDTARLHKKFERKLSTLVAKSTPPPLQDSMQDVVIECSRILSEYFVSNNYKALVKDALISEMQRKGNEILIDSNGATETAFFAAQRLKKATSLEVSEPATRIAYTLVIKMDEIARCRSMARKLTATMKNHVRDAADYLSLIVTTPDPQIEALVALLAEMEAQDSALLVEGNITKSYKDSASYLQCLISYEDKINLPNSSLQSTVESKLNSMMANVDPIGYTPADMRSVISQQTRLLVSYIMLQGVQTEALQLVIQQMDEAPEALLLRHGNVRKSNSDGADLLRDKNTDQLHVKNADPVVVRKVQIKLNNLMEGKIPDKYQVYMDDVILDATMFLAVELFKPHVVHVCKCMKSVFVQCELWCDEILRRVARPCCACHRVTSAQALAELRAAPGADVSVRPCVDACRAPRPAPGCEPTTSYMLYATEYNRQRQYVVGPTRLSPCTSETAYRSSPPAKSYSMSPVRALGSPLTSAPRSSLGNTEQIRSASSEASASYYTSMGPSVSNWREQKPPGSTRQSRIRLHSQIWPDDTHASSELEVGSEIPTRTVPFKEAYSCRTPIISTDQMADWHAMMVSLTWNVQAWRDWIQETIDRALVDRSYGLSPVGAEENWSSFHRRIATEALQWRQYNLFSRQLTLRLALRYRDKKIVSPTRATVKTRMYMECQKEMLEIINMFNRWTHWLSVVVKESDSVECSSNSDTPFDDQRWSYFKSKVEEYAEDWKKYRMYLKVCWEQTYMMPLKDWMPSWGQPGPVWVTSACGAVPSGAVPAGEADGERTWLARTSHGCRVLPAALRPSKHCCLLYADGAEHHYTKYQVMCNAEVSWVAWRAGAAHARAVRVAPGAHVGRVHYRGNHLVGAVLAPQYRCHVVIFGRPFAFNCYELLVMTDPV